MVAQAQVASLVFGSYADLDPTKDEIAIALEASFTPHESAYRGGDYWLGSTSQAGEEIIVQVNADEDGVLEPVNTPTLVYVERTRRVGEIRERLTDRRFVFVRQDDWNA